MTDAANILKTLYEAGTWSNYAAGPPSILVLYQDRRSKAAPKKGPRIELTNGRKVHLQTLSGSLLYPKKQVAHEIIGQNQAVVEQIFKDCIAILLASEYGFTLSGEDESISTAQFIQKFTIEVADFN